MVYSHTLHWSGWAPTLDATRDYVPPHLVPSGLPIDGARLLERYVAGRASVPCTCSILVRRDLIESVGGFEDGFRQRYTDQAFYSKLFLAGTVLPIDGCWAKYRQHPGSSTGTARRERRAREARQVFLTWLEDYLRGIPSAPPALRRTIRRELWRCRHPIGDWLLDRVVIFRRPARGLGRG